MTKETVDFRNFVNGPKNVLFIYQITALIDMCELL